MNTQGIVGHKSQIKNLEFLLNSDKIPQAILFTGMSGIGKKVIARRFIGSIFCSDKNPPCMKCGVCRQIADLTFPDFIEINENEKGIIPIGSDDGQEPGSIRWLIRKLSAKSLSGRYAALIDGVDKITEEGQNAILKLIEEPSAGTCFLLIASNKNNLLQTIVSRSAEVRFSPLSAGNVQEIIAKNDIPADAIEMIINLSGGSIEIAETLMDSDSFNSILEICKAVSSYCNNRETLELDLAGVQSKIKTDIMIEIIINIYRQNLLSLLREKKNFFPQLESVFISDEKKILEIIEVFLKLKRMESYNLNLKYAVKGLLYQQEMNY